MTVKMPEPMTAPMPRAVRDHGPRVFFSERSGSSDSLMSLSIDLRASSWLGRDRSLKAVDSEKDTANSRFAFRHRASLQSASVRCLLAAICGCYRLLWPRTIFFTLCFWEPRGVVRLALGAAFLRAARLSFLRSTLSAVFLVSATLTSFNRMSFTAIRSVLGATFYVNRETAGEKAEGERGEGLEELIPRRVVRGRRRCATDVRATESGMKPRRDGDWTKKRGGSFAVPLRFLASIAESSRGGD